MDLAYAAGRAGGTMTGVLSAANEKAVEMFIDEKWVTRLFKYSVIRPVSYPLMLDLLVLDTKLQLMYIHFRLLQDQLPRHFQGRGAYMRQASVGAGGFALVGGDRSLWPVGPQLRCDGAEIGRFEPCPCMSMFWSTGKLFISFSFFLVLVFLLCFTMKRGKESCEIVKQSLHKID